jgi:hypothetical protein
MFRTPSLLCAALCSALLAAGTCTPLAAQPLVDLDLVDRDTGQWLPEYPHRGRTWVPGEPGHRYAVRLTNITGERVLVVLSIDGVNAVSGQTAAASQTGYVLAPWQSTEIAGWRKSLDDVAQFYFTDLPDSYAARTGRPHDVGVIGIAVFQEAQPIRYAPPYSPGYPPAYPQPYPGYPRPYDEAKSRDSAGDASAPSASRRQAESAADAGMAAQQQQSLGTGHGRREWAPVSRTDFVRASRRPAQVTQLRYDESAALVALGILPRAYPHWRPRPEPQAFPAGFAADPPG